MNLKNFVIVIAITSFAVVKSAPLSLEEYIYDELVKRNIRSDRTEVNVEWPQQNEIREEEYAPHNDDDLSAILKNINFNKFRKKSVTPGEVYSRRTAENSKERIDKRNSNANYYMQLCHFKICNMGKRRSRYQDQMRKIFE